MVLPTAQGVGRSRRCGGGWYVSSIEHHSAEQREVAEMKKPRPLSEKPKRKAHPSLPLPPPPAAAAALRRNLQSIGSPPSLCSDTEVSRQERRPVFCSEADEGRRQGQRLTARPSTLTQMGRRASRPNVCMPVKDDPRIRRLRDELNLPETTPLPDTQYKLAARDLVVRALRTADADSLSEESLRRLRTMGIDATGLRCDRLTASAVSEMGVCDVRVHTVDAFPFDVEIGAHMNAVAAHLDNVSPGFSELFLREEVTAFVTPVFWFVFVAFFQKQDLPLFTALLSDLNEAQMKFFWSVLSEYPKKQQQGFFKLFHIAVAQVVCLAHVHTFKGSEGILQDRWASKVYTLVFHLITGIDHTPNACRCFRITLFSEPGPTFLGFATDPTPASEEPPAAPKEPVRGIAGLRDSLPKPREVQIGHSNPAEAYEIGVYQPRGTTMDGLRAAEASIMLVQKNCPFNLTKERFKFGKFPVDVNPGSFEADFNVFNSDILNYDTAMALRRGSHREAELAPPTPEGDEAAAAAAAAAAAEAAAVPAQALVSASTLELRTRPVTCVRSSDGRALPPGPFTEPLDEASRRQEERVEEVSTAANHSYVQGRSPRYDPFAYEQCSSAFRKVLQGYSFELSDYVKDQLREAKRRPPKVGLLNVFGRLRNVAKGAETRLVHACLLCTIAGVAAAEAAAASFVDLVKLAYTDPKSNELPEFTARVFNTGAALTDSSAHFVKTAARAAKKPQITSPSRYKRGANGVTVAKQYLYETSPAVDGTLTQEGVSVDMRVPRTQPWMMRTLSFGCANGSSYVKAQRIRQRHAARSQVEREEVDRELRVSMRRQNQLEQDLERIERLEASAHLDAEKRSEFCDRLTHSSNLTGKALGRCPANFKGSLLAEAATHVACSLERALRKLDQKLNKTKT